MFIQKKQVGCAYLVVHFTQNHNHFTDIHQPGDILEKNVIMQYIYIYHNSSHIIYITDI